MQYSDPSKRVPKPTYMHTEKFGTVVTRCLVTFLDDSTGSNSAHRIWGISSKSLNPMAARVCGLWLSDSVWGSDGKQQCDGQSMMPSSCTGQLEIDLLKKTKNEFKQNHLSTTEINVFYRSSK